MKFNLTNNLVVLVVVLVIIKIASPEPDSVLYILQKYLNYFIYQIKKVLFGDSFNNTNVLFDKNLTFTGINLNYPVAPSFKTPYENAYINFHKNKYPDISENNIIQIYHFLQTLVSIDTDNYFFTPSEIISIEFTDDELDKIKQILITKLNSESFTFDNFNYEYKPKYLTNVAGREIDPFVFSINSPIGLLRIFIDIDIRNDIYQNKDYLIINEIKPIKDKQVIFTNQNIYY
jgi:hypothetical protein